MAAPSLLLEATVLLALVGPWIFAYRQLGLSPLVTYTAASASGPATIAFIHSLLLLAGLQTTPHITFLLSTLLPAGATTLFSFRSPNKIDARTVQSVLPVTCPLFLAVLFSRVVSFERVNPDSLLYLAHSRLLRSSAQQLLDSPDLSDRGLGVSSYHSIASLIDMELFSSMQVNIGFATCALVFATGKRILGSQHSDRVTTILAAFGTLLLVSTDRFIFSHQLINQHGLVSLQLGCILLLIAALESVPAAKQKFALATLCLIASSVSSARPEGILLVTFLIVMTGISGLFSFGDRNASMCSAGLSLFVSILPWALIVRQTGSGLQTMILLGSPILVCCAHIARVYLSDFPASTRTVARRQQTRIAFCGYFTILVFWCYVDPARDVSLITRSLGNTATNLFINGGWGFSASFVLLALTLLSMQGSYVRLLLQDIILGSISLMIGLSVVRNGAFRVGPGDSLNRMIFHLVPLIGIYVTLALGDILGYGFLQRPKAGNNKRLPNESIR